MKVEPNEFFKEVTLRICGSLDIEQALSFTLEYIKQVMPIDAITLSYMDLARKRLFVVARVEREGIRLLKYKMVPDFPLDDDAVDYIKRVGAKESNILMCNRPEHYSDAMIRHFPHMTSWSTLNLLLKIHGQMIGQLLMIADGSDRYSHKDVELLESVKEPITIAMSNARRYQELMRMKDLLAEDHQALKADIKRATGVEVVGADFGLREVMEQVRQIAQSSSPTLLLGETGTGKEIIANAIHMASPRHEGPMISMQCGAVPETLLDSELFGHEKGAFTGASERKRGRFERADGGTLFLDEIGELSPEAQVKLLRVLQEKQFERVGGTQTIEVDVRVIAATHRDLDKLVREGKFREDLWYRLNVLPIRIPPLRLRRDDIPSLVQYFVERKAQEMNLLHIPQIDTHTLERLKVYDWPGNVRELQNIVERALILSRGGHLIFPELNVASKVLEDQSLIQSAENVMTLDQATANHIRLVLEYAGGKVAGQGGAAELLKINESTLRFRMKKLGIRR